MESFSVNRRVSPLLHVLGPALALLLAGGCSAGGAASSTDSTTPGGTTNGGSSSAQAGTTGSTGVTSAGSNPGQGGTTEKGGTSSPGTSAAAGSHSSGGVSGSAGAPGSGGTSAGAGGTVKGGSSSATVGSGGTPARDAGPGVDGASSSASVGDGGSSVNCSATMPTEGGKTYTGKNINGTVNGLNYGIWTDGNGGDITVFSNAHAFSAAWNESRDFLAHLGLDFRASKTWDAYGTIKAEFVENKSGTAGGFSMIGMYGWTQNPCVEWYINEDAWKGLNGRGNITATIDGEIYYLSTLSTTGTGGANACEAGHSGPWTQMISTRKVARTCGTVTVSDHFAAWEKQGWKMGALTSVHINMEVGGGTGKIEFPVANVTTTNK